MKLLGIATSLNKKGEKVHTLHTLDNFDSYYTDADSHRTAVGECVETIYVGTCDISGVKIGSEIDICYGKAITTASGTFQPVKRVDVIAKQ